MTSLISVAIRLGELEGALPQLLSEFDVALERYTRALAQAQKAGR